MKSLFFKYKFFSSFRKKTSSDMTKEIKNKRYLTEEEKGISN